MCGLGRVFVPSVPNIDVGKDFADIRGGMGMKTQVLVGYQVLKKIKYGSSRVWVHVNFYQKTLASLASDP